MKKTIKSFMIFVGTLLLVFLFSCKTPLDTNTNNELPNNTEIKDDSEITDNEENPSDDDNNESEIIDENPSDDDNNESEIIDENPSDDENKDDSEITDNEENPSDDENKDDSEIIDDTSNNNEDENNNGILSYNFDENTKVNNFEYVIYYNDNLMNWKYFAFTDDEKGCIIQINNMFNIRIDISSNNITVITYLDCPQDIKINNVEINNNTIIIKISNM